MVIVGNGWKSRKIGDKEDRRENEMMRIGDIGRVVVEGGNGEKEKKNERNRVGIKKEEGEEISNMIVKNGVEG